MVWLVVCLTLWAGLAGAASLPAAQEAFRNGKFAEAQTQLRELVKADPGNASLHYWLARSALAAGEAAAAADEFEVALKLKPGSFDVRYWLGMAYLKQGKKGEAEECFRLVLKSEANHAGALEGLRLLGPATAITPQVALGGTAALDFGRGRLTFSSDDADVDPGDLDILSANVCDYTFSSAPTDWLVRSGEWNATNRWTCSPQWSWYGGYSLDSIAAMWNKRQFVGDVTVELYMAYKMRLGRNPTYLHPGNVGIAICGDGLNPDSGYAFILGDEGNRVTRILRQGKVLAETRDPVALWPIYENGQPSTYEWHRKWWSLWARKAGGRLQLYYEGKLVLEATDPNPLPSGRVALWILQNDLITPRIKIYYEREKLPRDPLPDDRLLTAAPALGAQPEIALSSPSHPSVQNDFQNTLGRIESRVAEEPVQCRLVAGGPSGRGNCLQITNRVAGGRFGVKVVPESFDARMLSNLGFDYRVPADVKVNFYLTCAGAPLEVVFTGSTKPAPGRTLLGRIPGVVADDQWHHAEFDLLGSLQNVLGLDTSTVCGDLWVGNLNNQGNLLAGFGGNHGGATWLLDNFMLGQARGDQLELNLLPRPPAEPDGFAVSLDNDPLGQAPQVVNCPASPYRTALKGEGRQYVHVRPRLKGGKWGTSVTYAVDVDRTPPKVTATVPTAGGAFTDAPVSLAFNKRSGSGLDLKSLHLTLNSTPLSLDSPGVRYDPDSCRIVLSPSQTPLRVKDGEAVALTVTAAADRAGNALAAPEVFTFKAQAAADKQAPPAPALQIGDGYLVDEGFETGLGEFANYGGDSGATLSRDDTTANSGRYSLRLTCPVSGGRLGAYVVQKAFDAGKYRIVSFAYKCDDRLRADFAVYVNGDWKAIRFTDNDDDLGVVGSVPDVQADNQWHTASFNLYDLLRKDDPTAPAFMVRQFVVADWGWPGNRVASHWNLDDFRLVPVVSSAAPVLVKALSTSIFGLPQADYQIAAQPQGSLAASQALTSGSEGPVDLAAWTDGWLNLRVRDGAGNWSPVTSRRFLADNQTPEATPLGPAAEAKAAQSQIVLSLKDRGWCGVDPHSVKLRVSGVDYSVDGQGLRFDPQRNVLTWDCEEVYPSPVVFKDGQKVDVQLLSAANYAGNAVKNLPGWSWTMDYTLDKTAPAIREIQSTTHPTLFADTFEEGLGRWQTREPGAGAVVSLDQADAASGKGCVKLVNPKAGGHMQATVWDQPYLADRYPIISFDYKLGAETRLNVGLQMGGKWFVISLNDNPSQVVGRVPGIVADNRWHHASLDVAPMLRRQRADGPLLVEQIMVGDAESLDNPAGAEARFDNFIVGSIGRYPPVLRWRATDTTGIKGYSYALDGNPVTVPDEVSEGTEPAKSFASPEPGLLFFHVRAQDGAGNWGPTRTYVLMHQK